MLKEIKWRKRRPIAPMLSAFIPGLGQAFTGRWSSAIFFAILFITPFFFMRFIPVELNIGHYIMFPFLFLCWLINIFDAYRGTKPRTAPCIEACPANINIPQYINLVVEQRYEECHSLITRRTPLVGVIGHVCHHPCESKCTRHTFDEAVAICPIKAFVGSYMIRQGRLKQGFIEKASPSGKKVAIIGSGPAGLTAGYFLARLGFSPTIYESFPVAGGMLAVGIPPYRLPRSILNEEIAFIQESGVEIKTGLTIGRDLSIADLFNEGHLAVFASPGTHREIKLRIEGENKEGVISGLEFLRSVNLGERTPLEGEVIVVGGGNVAMDAARSALRLGASKVTVIYRRSRREMPANDWEVTEAEEEGVNFLFLTNPVKVLGGSSVKGIESLEMKLGEPDDSGRRRPVPIEGSNFTIPCSYLIPAIGLTPETSFLESAGVKLSPKGIITTRRKMMTHSRSIFAGGDAVTGASSVIEASFGGREAAINIYRYLSGRSRFSFKRIKVGRPRSEFPSRPRVPQASLNPEERRQHFNLIHKVYSEEEVLSEGRRCLRCDLNM